MTGLPRRTVLVVESNGLLNLCMVNLVKMAGFPVVAVANADDAMLALNARADIALVVTNVVMPGSMNGVELAHAVDVRWPSIKLMVVSGKRGLSEDDLPAKSLLLAKPYHDAELIFEICALVDPQPS